MAAYGSVARQVRQDHHRVSHVGSNPAATSTLAGVRPGFFVDIRCRALRLNGRDATSRPKPLPLKFIWVNNPLVSGG